jgi:hypothetical protein
MKDVQGYLGLARIAEKQNRISDAIIIYRELVSMKGLICCSELFFSVI